jgi:hypothetical protein
MKATECASLMRAFWSFISCKNGLGEAHKIWLLLLLDARLNERGFRHEKKPQKICNNEFKVDIRDYR